MQLQSLWEDFKLNSKPYNQDLRLNAKNSTSSYKQKNLHLVIELISLTKNIITILIDNSPLSSISRSSQLQGIMGLLCK